LDLSSEIETGKLKKLFNEQSLIFHHTINYSWTRCCPKPKKVMHHFTGAT